MYEFLRRINVVQHDCLMYLTLSKVAKLIAADIKPRNLSGLISIVRDSGNYSRLMRIWCDLPG